MKNKYFSCYVMVIVVFMVAETTFAQLFTKVTTGPVVTYAGSTWGGAWGDYDNDGDLDLFVTNAFNRSNHLYTNEGDGSFTKIREGDIASLTSDSFGAVWADLDNDGDLDMFVANGGVTGKSTDFHLLNNGEPDFTFSLLTDGGLGVHYASSHNSCLGDFNGDGYLDVFVANDFGEENFLFTNNRNGGFTRVNGGAITATTLNTKSAHWVDYDDDEDLDLFIVNYDEDNVLYEHVGRGNFKVTSGAMPEDKLASSMGASWGDFDNDGDQDVFIANAEQEKNLLYKNNGNGTFSNVVTGPIVSDDGSSQGSGWADFDNDGDLDLFVANSDRKNVLYENIGDGNFTRVASWPPDTEPVRSSGLAWGDIDNDGDLDLFVANPFAKNSLYINNAESKANHWVNINCTGVFSNRSAIGTKIRINAIINGKSVWQYREITSISGAYGQNSLKVHFGLGDARVIDKIRIEWPSGLADAYDNVSVNKFYRAVEDKNLIEDTKTILAVSNGKKAASAKGFRLAQNHPNPFNPTTTISYSVNRHGNVSLRVYDILGREIRTLVDKTQRAGFHSVVWDGQNNSGEPVASGHYFYRIRAGDFHFVRKMVLLK